MFFFDSIFPEPKQAEKTRAADASAAGAPASESERRERGNRAVNRGLEEERRLRARFRYVRIILAGLLAVSLLLYGTYCFAKVQGLFQEEKTPAMYGYDGLDSLRYVGDTMIKASVREAKWDRDGAYYDEVPLPLTEGETFTFREDAGVETLLTFTYDGGLSGVLPCQPYVMVGKRAPFPETDGKQERESGFFDGSQEVRLHLSWMMDHKTEEEAQKVGGNFRRVRVSEWMDDVPVDLKQLVCDCFETTLTVEAAHPENPSIPVARAVLLVRQFTLKAKGVNQRMMAEYFPDLSYRPEDAFMEEYSGVQIEVLSYSQSFSAAFE